MLVEESEEARIHRKEIPPLRKPAPLQGRSGSSAGLLRSTNAVAFAESCTERFEVRDQKFEIRCGY